MKTKIKRHSRSVISVLLAVCMLVSCMTAGMIMTDAAKVDDAVGEWGNNKGNYFCVKIGTVEKWTPIDGSTESAEIDLSSYSDGDTVSFDLYATEYNGAKPLYFNKSANISATQGSSYTFQTGGSSGSSQNTFTVADKGKIKVKGSWENGSLRLTVSSASGSSAAGSPKTYYYKGDTEGWNGIEMAETSSGVYSTAVTFTADSQKFKFYESSKNKWYGHGSSGYPISTSAWGSQLNEGGQNIKAPGTGRYILYFRPSDKKAYAEAAPVESTLSIAATIPNAAVSATYNGTTINEGGSMSNVPAGAQVTITVNPDTAGQVCTAITTTPEGIVSNSGGTWKLTMPEQNASINSVTVGDAAPRTVYFNNYVSQWSKVYVYTKKANGADGNGAAPGTEMTQVGTSSVYSAVIPGDTITIVFSGSGGSTNEGSTHITYKTNTNYGNSLPSDYNEYKATNTSSGANSTGEWTTHSDRDNVYTVTPGTSITGNNGLYYNGITATLYDYYTDGEYNSGNAKWITGIKTHQSGQRTAEYSVDNGKEFKWNPYKTFNAALSSYAADNSVPYPLYFGNLNIRDSGQNNSEGYLQYVGGEGSSVYTNWADKISNSVRLKPDGTSVTGLASATENNSTIAHSNGAAMMMFDEDWLSQENATGNPLATILHSSAFPVRKITVSRPTKLYLNPNNDWTSSNAWFAVCFRPNSGNTSGEIWRKMTYDSTSGYYVVEIPSGVENYKVIFARMKSSDTSTLAWSNKWNDTGELNMPTDNNALCNITGWNNSSNWSAYGTVTSYTYYEYDSTNGTDNAYIQNVKTGDHTATIEYSTTEKAYSANAGGGSTAGFYPFDNMKASDSSHTNDIDNVHLGTNRPHDLGFGMKLEIPFSLNKNGTVDGTPNGIAQTFNFSGDDDLWVYIDGHLVLDLGGAHKKAEGSIDFKNKTATSTTKVAAASAVDPNTNNNDYTATDTYSNNFSSWFDAGSETLHTMTIYYMERGMFESNLKFDFSFHAIQNLYTTEKKIRTGNINSGFYVKDATTRDPVTGMTKFEASYQYEHFKVEHKVSSDNITYANPTNKFNYARVEITPTPNGDTKVTHNEEHAANADLVYNLTNDDRAQFNGKFKSGDYFELKETPSTDNKYSYTPTLRVFDDNDKTGATKSDVPIRDDGTFRFQFGEPDPNGLKTINVRGQLENEMKHHDLTITKSIGDKTDTDTEFVFRITFNFDYEGGGADNGYEGYPLYISSNKDPSKTQLDSFSIGGSSALSMGYFKIKAGETITIPKIPEGAKFQIEEILGGINEYHADPITNYSYGGMAADVAGATPVIGKNAVTMTMGEDDVAVTATNVFADNFTISKKILDGMKSTETYIINIKTKDTFTTSGTATAYKGPYVIKHTDGTTESVASDDTRTKCQVTLNPNEEIKIGVVNETIFEITEEALSSTYRRKFHYVSSTVDGTPFNTDTADTANVKKVTNGVLVKVTSENKRVDINNKAWGYMIEYTYPGYLKRYGVKPGENQKYYVSGLFSEADYDDGTVELAEVADHSNNDVAVQGVRFKSDEIQKNFITSHAPYEDNFMTDLTWNPIFVGTGANTTRFFYANDIGTEVNMKLNVVATENKQCQVYFRIPFAYTASTENGFVPTPSSDDGGKVLKTDAIQMSVQAPYGKWFTMNNQYTEADAKFVTAPREIYEKKGDGYDKYVFLYWSMQTTKSGIKGDNTHALRTTEEYKRCYYWDFNMTFYQDTIVEPVYALAGDEGTNLTPAQLEARDTANGGGTNITFLENSRNQWNRNGGNNQEIDSRKPQGDRVYSDFLLSFSWNDDMLRNALSKKFTEKREINGEEVEVTYYLPYTVGNNELHYSGGLVIEKVAAAPEITSTSDIKTQDEYRDLYGDGEGDNLVAAATDFINSGKTSEGNFLLNETFSATGFDNKNQFEYSTSFANKSHSDLTIDRPYKRFVYRAYTYLRDYDGSAATTDNCMVNGANASPAEVNTINGHTGSLLAVSKPVYFTIYEMATIENGIPYTGQGES